MFPDGNGSRAITGICLAGNESPSAPRSWGCESTGLGGSLYRNTSSCWLCFPPAPSPGLSSCCPALGCICSLLLPAKSTSHIIWNVKYISPLFSSWLQAVPVSQSPLCQDLGCPISIPSLCSPGLSPPPAFLPSSTSPSGVPTLEAEGRICVISNPVFASQRPLHVHDELIASRPSPSSEVCSPNPDPVPPLPGGNGVSEGIRPGHQTLKASVGRRLPLFF